MLSRNYTFRDEMTGMDLFEGQKICHIERSEDNLLESVFSLHHLGPGD